VEAGQKIFIGNNIQNIYDMMIALVDEIEKAVWYGHPGIHKVTPVTKASLELFKQTHIKTWLTASK
jgi:hypothetical protein